MTAAWQSNVAAHTPDFFEDGICHQCVRHTRRQGILPRRLAKPGGWAVTDVRDSKPLAKAIGARRETQRHLECLTRQIASRARRQEATVKAWSRTPRRSGPRTHHQELVDRLTFERWVELDVIACRLAVQGQLIGELQGRANVPVHHPAT